MKSRLSWKSKEKQEILENYKSQRKKRNWKSRTCWEFLKVGKVGLVRKIGKVRIQCTGAGRGQGVV